MPADPSSRSRTRPDPTASVGPFARLGGRIGRHAGVYAIGSGVTILFGLASVAALTRLLPPSEYGRLAVLFVFASVLTVIYNLGALQGTFSWVFGGSDEEVVDDTAEAGASDKRAALGTAFVYFMAAATVGTLLIAAAAPLIADLLLGERDDADAVTLAAVAGGLGAVWRLVANVPRLERRPLLYNVFATIRATAVFGFAVLLVAEGHGVEGALLGTAIGTATAALIGLPIIRRSFRIAFNSTDLKQILRQGRPMIPIILAFWVLNQFDLLLLSQYVSDADVGVYRVASRVGSVLSYFVSAFLMAWLPLSRTSITQAVKGERGGPAMNSVIMNYFVVASLGVLLVLALGADTLVKIADPSYSGAGDLITLIGTALVGYGCFLVLYRVSSFPRRRLAYVSFAVAGALIFNGAALVLIPLIGTYGAATALIVGNFSAAAGLLVCSQRGPRPVPFEYLRIAAVFAIAAGCYLAAKIGGELVGTLRAPIDVAAIAAYPLLLVVTRTIPPAHLQPLRTVARSLLPERRARARVASGLARVRVHERAALEILLRHRLAENEVADVARTEPDELRIRAVRALRTVAGLEPRSTATDAAIGAYLLSRGAVAERDAAARRLWSDGADPAELDLLEHTARTLTKTPSALWAAIRDADAPHSPADPGSGVTGAGHPAPAAVTSGSPARGAG